ncbi:MAG: tetratricopeptide repeat protein [Planctomycetaceae bacterium]|nr:tetratricopeptide repeat protein [Planctomycetaceae bacterium]
MSSSVAPRRNLVVAVGAIVLFASAFAGEPAVLAQDAPGVNAGAANQQFNVAGGFHNRQAWDLAAEEWAKFLKDFPADPRAAAARFYLGQCQLQLKQFDKAAATLKPLIAARPKLEQMPVAQLSLGIAEFNLAQQGDEKQFAAAEQTLSAALRDHSDGKHVPQTVYYLAESLYAQGKLEQAEPLYRRVVTEFSDNVLAPDALYSLGVTLEELKRGEAALDAYAKFVDLFPKHALRTEVNVRRADLIAAAGDYAAAETLFSAAAADADYADADYALLRRAGCLFEQKQFAAAAAVYEQLAERFPKSKYREDARFSAGRAHYFAGQYDQSAFQLAPLARGNGDRAAEAAHWSARALLKTGKPAAAEKLLAGLSKETLAARNYAAQLALDAADALYDQADRRADALKAYKQLIVDFPGDQLAAQALYLASLTALELGCNDEARKHAEAYLKSNSDGKLRAEVLFILGEAALRSGDNKQAAFTYDELLKSDGEHADRSKWLVRRSYALSGMGDHKAVVASLAPAVADMSGSALRAEAYQLLGVARQALKDYSGAVVDLSASLKLDAKRSGADEVLWTLAESQRLAGDLPAAQASFERLATEYPQSKLLDSALYRRGEAAYAAGDLAGAEVAYRRIVAEYPQSQFAPYARFGLAWTALGKKDPAGAVAAVDGLLKSKGPAELETQGRYARALAFEQLGKFQPAIDDLQVYLKAKAPGGERSEAMYRLGRCQVGMNRNEDALATFEALLKADSGYEGAPKVLYEIGWIHKKAERPADSAKAFAKLAKQYSSSPLAAEALFHVGEEAYGRQDYQTAIDAFYDAREKADSPELEEKSAYNLGLTYFHKGDFAKAEQWFHFEIEKFPKGSLAQNAQFRKAEAQFKQKKYREALAEFKLVRAPGDGDFLSLAALRIGQCAAQLDDWQSAEASLSEAVQKFSSSPHAAEINYELAWAKQNLGRVDEALKLYELVTEQSQDVVAARARFMIGEIYFERKDHNEAVRHFFRAAVGYDFPEWQARAHFEAGRCFEVMGKLDQAKKSYQEVVDKFGRFEEGPLAKKRLEALGTGG